MKYVIFEQKLPSGETLKIPVVFPDHVAHSEAKVEGFKAVSAAFASFTDDPAQVVVHGKSTSLRLKSKLTPS